MAYPGTVAKREEEERNGSSGHHERAGGKSSEKTKRDVTKRNQLVLLFLLDILLSAGLYWIDVLGEYHPMVWECLFN